MTRLLVCLMFSLVVSSPAQPAPPHIGYIYPAGGRQGTKFEVAIGGQFLDSATNAFVSGNGIRAIVIDHVKPLTPKQAKDLREEMIALQEKRQNSAADGKRAGGMDSTNVFTAGDRSLLLEIRKKLSTFIRQPASPAIAEKVTLEITIEPDAEPGTRELRLATLAGLSNPMSFCIGQLPEFRKQAPPAERPFARNGGPRDGSEPRDAPVKKQTM